ncbi:glutathione S-transferase [uncultured Legionella sp.]|uniref:glutathione S-transferase n=1 Tax=uncultured Legionella sp. TaxID=210934 RepID=UPI0026191AD1|nr:glutathione S-transferase [uncultured Legionella sp.]
MSYPILYTFRRCPYAIRARMILAYSKIKVEQREVDLKNKPQELLDASAKGTVPVLIMGNGQVLDESMEIIRWSLNNSDPEHWFSKELQNAGDELIYINDTHFKPILDNYKYPQKSEKKDPYYYREQAETYLEQLDSLLKINNYLLASHISYADVAIFPFIRQFCMVDKEWFEHSQYKHLQVWLNNFLKSELFLSIMEK